MSTLVQKVVVQKEFMWLDDDNDKFNSSLDGWLDIWSSLKIICKLLVSVHKLFLEPFVQIIILATPSVELVGKPVGLNELIFWKGVSSTKMSVIRKARSSCKRKEPRIKHNQKYKLYFNTPATYVSCIIFQIPDSSKI